MIDPVQALSGVGALLIAACIVLIKRRQAGRRVEVSQSLASWAGLRGVRYEPRWEPAAGDPPPPGLSSLNLMGRDRVEYENLLTSESGSGLVCLRWRSYDEILIQNEHGALRRKARGVIAADTERALPGVELTPRQGHRRPKNVIETEDEQFDSVFWTSATDAAFAHHLLGGQVRQTLLELQSQPHGSLWTFATAGHTVLGSTRCISLGERDVAKLEAGLRGVNVLAERIIIDPASG